MDFADLNLNFMTEDIVMNAVHTYVAATPTARVNMPKLLSIDNVFEWIEDVRRYVILAEQATPEVEVAAKKILSIGGKEDATLAEFQNAI